MGDQHGNAMQATSLVNMFKLNTRKRGLRDWGLACVARKMVNPGLREFLNKISGQGASLSNLISNSRKLSKIVNPTEG